jgi:hypothetical protein
MMRMMMMKWRRSHNLSNLYYVYYSPNLSLRESGIDMGSGAFMASSLSSKLAAF